VHVWGGDRLLLASNGGAAVCFSRRRRPAGIRTQGM